MDNFVAKLGPAASKHQNGLNVVEWYEMMSFDILGEMAFGTSFGCIEKGIPIRLFYFPAVRLTNNDTDCRRTSFLDHIDSRPPVGNYCRGQFAACGRAGHAWKILTAVADGESSQ